MTPCSFCIRPVMTRAGSKVMMWRNSSKSFGRTMAFAWPVSSSRVMKQNPLAVPGRWRAMTEPPIFTVAPERTRGNSAAGHRSGSCSRKNFIGCGPVVSDCRA